MPERVSAWAVYEIFETGDGGQLFVGITSDAHWQRFCHEAGLAELAADEGLARNNQRIAERPRLIPALKAFFATITQPRAAEICAAARIPFAEVRRPEDLFTDPHLAATQGLLPVELPNGTRTALPRLPIRMAGLEPFATNPPAPGQDSRAILAGYGLDEAAIDNLAARGIVIAP
jgi:crotonobetainyl-CoA:carnitine CoA-transferase CaiB-like acyl-CoA transferase